MRLSLFIIAGLSILLYLTNYYLIGQLNYKTDQLNQCVQSRNEAQYSFKMCRILLHGPNR